MLRRDENSVTLNEKLLKNVISEGFRYDLPELFVRRLLLRITRRHRSPADRKWLDEAVVRDHEAF